MLARLGLLVLILVLLTSSSRSAELFPFVISYDAPENVTNVSGWLHRPAGKHGFVRAHDGHFVTDAGRIRFWATNFCFEACFPAKPDAEKVAARLARFGINCVRMHHMDNHSIWGKSPNKTIIDPEKLDRLDYLIYQLKRHGVYVNINLHVSRWLGDKEGFPHRDQRPNYDKGVGNFEPRMIELQRKYARDLLTHVNPYTGTAYIAEPAVAFVEISNEDALFAVWGWGQLDSLPDPYATTFRGLWNAWLHRKHKTTEALAKAWNVGRKEMGEELLANGAFARPLDGTWHLERDDQCKASWSVEKGGPEGKPFLRVVVERLGKAGWVPQFQHGGFAVEKGEPYTLTFRARAAKPTEVRVNCMAAHEPWTQHGFYRAVKIGAEWKRHRFTFVVAHDDENARITFTDLKPGTLELAAVSLRPGGIVGLEPGQTLEDGSVPVLKKNQMNATEAARRDFVDFLWDTERDYWHGMYRFLKDELKVKSLVSGTQLSYSPVHVQAGLDYIDAHSYWNHPSFPGRPWDSNNWFVRNRALVNSPGGTLAGLAARRVYGKPYTCSEYNHPAPNAYAAEGFPMLAAFGAFQDWDGLFPFAYNHSPDFEPRKITSYFDYKSNTPKMVAQIACAALFLRGDLKPGGIANFVHLPPKRERETLYQTLSAWSLTTDKLGLDARHPLWWKTGFVIDEVHPPSPAEYPVPPTPEADPNIIVSSTGELRWDVSQKGAGYFAVKALRSKLFTGFVRGRVFDLGNMGLAVGKTMLDWATVTMTCIDGEGFDQPGRILITATGHCQNTGWKMEDLGGNRITLRRNWGTAPVLCEGIPAEVVLPVAPDRAALYPLDESGNRRAAIAVAARDGKAVLKLGPEHKTIWYEVEIR